ncbi:MAG: hypothetical protein PWP31_1115 [Clostridia bacterium]|nr:hypothetical protein [Clostridia bacterium]
MSKIIGNSLPQEIVDLFNKELTTVVLSTLSTEGYPHAMPVHLLFAPNNKTIRMALMKTHQTTENIKKHSKVFITVLEGTDIAMGIKGTAKVIKDTMDGNKAMCMIEINVEQIKSDTTPTVIVNEGIKIKHRSPKTASFFRTMFDELYKC